MSDPWLKVYLGDMRADLKLHGMNANMLWALVNAYDLAKNGPGEVGELRASDGRAMSERELRRMSNVSGSATRRMFERWAERDLCELSDEDGKVLVNFPNLAKRQGIDRTAAARKRRQRERQRHGMSRQSHGESHGQMSRHVTGENQNQKELYERPPASGLSQVSSSRKARRERPRDQVWDAFVEGCEYEPGTPTERGAWNKARKEAGDATREDVLGRCAEFKRRYPNFRCTPTAVVRQWGALDTTNGSKPQRSMEDYERIIAEHEGRPTPTEEGMPY